MYSENNVERITELFCHSVIHSDEEIDFHHNFKSYRDMVKVLISRIVYFCVFE